MTSAFSWQNSISLCPASFCIPRPNLPVTPGVSYFVLVYEGVFVGLVAQSCLTLCNPMVYSPPDSSVHGIFQARIL